MTRRSSVFVVAASLLLGGCGLLEPRERVVDLFVAPNVMECWGPWPRTCLVTRESPSRDWTLFYDHVAGFEYEPGYVYALRVGVRRVENPPADGSALAYRLISVRHKRSCSVEFAPMEVNPEPPDWVGC